MLPLAYATRNLLRTPSRCLQLVGGSAMVVLLIVAAAAFERAMDRGLVATGDPQNIILLGAGSEESVERSEVPQAAPDIVAGSVPGLASVGGRPAVSGEVVYNTVVGLADGGERNALLRGVTPMALAVHRQVRLTDGHFPGADELLVGARAHDVLGVPAADLAPGRTLHFEGGTYRISGRFIAPGTVLESEIWIERGDLMAATGRDTLSCVVVRTDTATIGDLELFTGQWLDLELVAIDEPTYYRRLAAFFGPIKTMAWITALLIAAGAVFGGLNTLYAAFAARLAEIGTLQAIGFRRWMIATSLVQESCLATLAGTVVALLAAVLILDGRHVAFNVGVFTLHIDATVMWTGLLAGAALGLLGCLPPAWRCLRPPIPAILRGL